MGSFKCPNCGATTWGNLRNCPNCGEKLTKECPKCGGSWRYMYKYKFCPNCGTETQAGARTLNIDD